MYVHQWTCLGPVDVRRYIASDSLELDGVMDDCKPPIQDICKSKKCA